MIQRVESPLRIFSWGQILATITGAVGVALISSFLPGVPIGLVLLVCLVAALGGGGALVLLNLRLVRGALYTFVLSSIIAVGLSLLIFGVRTGVPALFAWPIATAAMLLGTAAGIGATFICATIIAVGFAFESTGGFTPALTGEADSVIGAFCVALSLSLVVVVATVAGGSIRRALAETQRTAAELVQTNATLNLALETERGVKKAAGQLADGLLDNSAEQKEVAGKASAAISQVAGQVSELTAAAAQIAVAARLIREVGERSLEMADDAKGRLDRDREQLNQAVSAGEQMQFAAKQAGDNIRQMGQIINLITEVAEETHMLSLNATIEATNTGESGRRFRVIATEVGNLANKVNTSTEQVAAIIQAVQRTVQTMLTSANQTVDSIKRSQVSNLATGEQIEQVSEAASDVAREGFLIVSSTEQQRRSTELIEAALQQVLTISQQAVASSEQLTQTAAELNDTVERLVAITPEGELARAALSANGSDGSGGTTKNPQLTKQFR